MLDSDVDREEDLSEGNHSYVERYPTGDACLRRVGELVQRSACEAHALRNGYRHAAIVACRVAQFAQRGRPIFSLVH